MKKLLYVEVADLKKPKYSFDNVKDTYDNMKNAALLVPEGIVVIDFDGDNIDKNEKIYDEEIIYYLLEKHNTYWTKSRAHHFQLYYKLPKDLKIKII